MYPHTNSFSPNGERFHNDRIWTPTGFLDRAEKAEKERKQEMKVRGHWESQFLVTCLLPPATCHLPPTICLWMPAHSSQTPHFSLWWRRLISKCQYFKTSTRFPTPCSSAQAWSPECDTSRDNFSFRVLWESHPDLSCNFFFVALCSLTVTSSHWVPDMPPALHRTCNRDTDTGLSASGVSVLLRRTDL